MLAHQAAREIVASHPSHSNRWELAEDLHGFLRRFAPA
jgi:hypothetical protein